MKTITVQLMLCALGCLAIPAGTGSPGLRLQGSQWCGDGVVDQGEGCDDSNNFSGDGCTLHCQVEKGWKCLNTWHDEAGTVQTKSICQTVCGDGIVSPPSEQCDSSPGCNSQCLIEKNYAYLTGVEQCKLEKEKSGNGLYVTRTAGQSCNVWGHSPQWQCNYGCVLECTVGCVFGEVCRGYECSWEWTDTCEPAKPAMKCSVPNECDHLMAPTHPTTTAGSYCHIVPMYGGVINDGCKGQIVQPGWECTWVWGARQGTHCPFYTMQCSLQSCFDRKANEGWDSTYAGGYCNWGTATPANDACENNQVQPGWKCSWGWWTDCITPIMQCSAVCGDGIVPHGSAERCDDGNTISGDGCSAECQIEENARFSVQAYANAKRHYYKTRTAICGNGQVDVTTVSADVSDDGTQQVLPALEQCDDNNGACSNTCTNN